MVYDRPSWNDIDKMRDRGGSRKRREKQTKDVQEHSSRYDKYKADLNRLFDQGMAGELLKKAVKEEPAAPAAPAPRRRPRRWLLPRKPTGASPPPARLRPTG